jgi:transposase InsO family protein
MEGQYSVQLLCKVLDVSRSCYYGWRSGQTYQVTPKNITIENQVVEVFQRNKRRYGSRRIVAALSHRNVHISLYKARQLLSRNGLRAIQPRSFVPKTTNSRHTSRISPNLLKTRPFPSAINEVWVGDITYIPMADGKFNYLSTWMDLYSRRIVGWDLQDHMRESLVSVSLLKALNNRSIKPGLLVHSDKGGQYASTRFRAILDKKEIDQSMSDTKNAYDNAHMESFFSRFKAELLEGGVFQNTEDGRTEIFEFIEMYYNTERIHSSLGYLSPNDYEKRTS